MNIIDKIYDNTKDGVPNYSFDMEDGRNTSYDLSVKSWKHWCDKYNVDLVVWDELVFPMERMKHQSY